ncbi:MAG: hypothetical protein CVU65_12050 [Deltaproteobacteria bacterium HGW-Deltaproteobacteria-22]|nr:MAG: hypothetical protein CVU65_12050 [Deltaproteobacteria bacterium HGW-Deltaproteobacteria-22]
MGKKPSQKQQAKNPFVEQKESSTLKICQKKNNTKAAKAAEGADPVKRRVTLRKGTHQQIEANQPRNAAGDMIDPKTQQPLKPGEIDVGHKPGQEWRKRQQMHRERGSTRPEVRDAENDPNLYQLEDRSSNRSHKYEQD